MTEMNRQGIIDGLTMMIASIGAEDAHAGRDIDPARDQYWYRVGYYIAKHTIEPEEAMEMAGKDFPLE